MQYCIYLQTCSRKKRAAGFDEDFTELTDTVDDIEASLELVVVRLPLEDEDISNGRYIAPYFIRLTKVRHCHFSIGFSKHKN